MSLRQAGPSRATCARPRVGAIVLLAIALFAAGCGRRVRPSPTPRPPAGAGSFTATAYCQGTITASGIRPTSRTVAADPAVLPMGTRIRIGGLGRYDGVYLVQDTGADIRGRRIDLYMRDCREAIRFGRRTAKVAVMK